jgi:large subunit ribosomal protein L28
MDAIYGKISQLNSRVVYARKYRKGRINMAKCAHCGKSTTFGRNRPWSNKATRRTFRPNLQTISVYENGRKVRKVLCAKCIRTLVKTS